MAFINTLQKKSLLEALLRNMGGLGGVQGGSGVGVATPGINPAAPPPVPMAGSVGGLGDLGGMFGEPQMAPQPMHQMPALPQGMSNIAADQVQASAGAVPELPAVQSKFGSFLSKIQGGLGRLGSPDLSGYGMNPTEQEQAQKYAAMNMGLGLLGSVGTGQPIGPRIANAAFGSQESVGNALDKQQLQRFREEQARRQAEQARQAEAHQSLGDLLAVTRETRQGAQDQQTQDNTDREFRANEAWRRTQAAMERARMAKENTQLIQTVGPNGEPIYSLIDKNTGKTINPNVGPSVKASTFTKPTDTQRAAAGFTGRMERAASSLDQLNYVPSTLEMEAYARILEGKPGVKQTVMNSMLSPKARQYFSNLSDFTLAKNRKESGAVIKPEEIFQDMAAYFPLPNDDEATKQLKVQARKQILSGFKEQSGSAYMAPGGDAGESPAASPSARPPLSSFNGQR